MRGLSEILDTPLEMLPSAGTGKVPDFAGLWESWSSKGPAVFLESAGLLGSASQWLILAGLPQAEYFERDEKAWWGDASGIQPASIDFWRFADQVGNAQRNFSTLPSCLAQAWFGILSYDFGKKTILRNLQYEAHSTRSARSGEHAMPTFHKTSKGGRYSTDSRNPFMENRHKTPRKPEIETEEKAQTLKTSTSTPDFYFFKPSRIVAYNRRSRETFFFGRESWNEDQDSSGSQRPFGIHGLRALSSMTQYETRVKRVQEYISQGDVYQANIAQAFQARWEGSAGTLYRILREMNPGPFMGSFQGNGFTVVSSSPERLAAGQGDWLETRPIAGTRPRGKDDPEDLRLRQELKTNAKEQAEHLMLVDLARNDLGRVSRYGTVEVERYAEIESYARVHHLVSTVRSQRRPDALLSEILKSLFPGGTITGCPKIRCMEIVDEVEQRPRGFYTGSMGYLAPGPCFDFNILIRSFTLFSNGLMEFQAGAGIVADSDPRREYLETLYKVEALAQSLGTSLVANP